MKQRSMFRARILAVLVLVVGVSHSGADIAFETAATHPTILSGRSHGQLPFAVIDTWRARIVWPIVAFAAAHLLTIRTPIGRKLGPELRKGGGPLLHPSPVDEENKLGAITLPHHARRDRR